MYSIILKNILVVFFAINAIFWSLFPHTIHCNFAGMFLSECPSHGFYLTIGFLSFIIAFIIAQYDYLSKFFK